jgi:CHAD domain-containing protein
MAAKRPPHITFDVAPDFRTDVDTLPLRHGDRVDSSEQDLVHVYYDTAQLDLVRARLGICRDDDPVTANWHLELPGPGVEPPGWPTQPSRSMPDQLRDTIAPFTVGNPVRPILQVQLRRAEHIVRTESGARRLIVWHDQVRATGMNGAEPVVSRWHQVEVRLGPAARPADLNRIRSRIRLTGGTVAESGSPVVRALSERRHAAQPGSAGEFVLAYLSDQTDLFTAAHVELATGRADATDGIPYRGVQWMRRAMRRYRSILSVFAPLFDADRAGRLDTELSWFAAELGEIRDRHVLRATLAAAVDELPSDLVIGPVAKRIGQVLSFELRDLGDALPDLMSRNRYRDLVDELMDWREAAPITPAAHRPARSSERELDKAGRRLVKRLEGAAHADAGNDRLHAARSAAVRVRHAAEAAGAVIDRFGPGAADGTERPLAGARGPAGMARRAHQVQRELTRYRDATLAATVLCRIADQVFDEGESTFTYGVLAADQRRAAEQSALAVRRISTR